MLGARHAQTIEESIPLREVPVEEFSVYGPYEVGKSWDEISAKVGLDYMVNEDVLFYGSASKGFRSGGFDGRAVNLALFNTPFNPEFVWTYELGIKSELLDNRLRLNVIGFYSDYKDRQVTTLETVFDPVTGLFAFLPTITNNGAAEVKGFEVEAIGVLNDRFRLELNAGLADAKFTDEFSKAAGDVVPYTPKWTVAIAGEYNTRLPELGDLAMRVDYSYRSEVALSIQQTEITTAKSFGLLNARITLELARGRWALAAYGRNLTDKIYKNWAIDQFIGIGLTRATYSDPREYGITVTRRF